jgi:pilus assembly protein Flp/PilA
LNFVNNILRDENGVTAIEYSLISALVAVVIVVGAGAFGTGLGGIFQRVADCVVNRTQAVCDLVV